MLDFNQTQFSELNRVLDNVCKPLNNLHYCYESELSGIDKVTCDNNFLEEMVDFCNNNSVYIDFDKCLIMAYADYSFFNIFGRTLYKGDMDVRDCIHAYDKTNCLLGHSPEIVQNAWNSFKSGYNYGEMALKTGWGKVEDAGGWVGNKVVEDYPK